MKTTFILIIILLLPSLAFAQRNLSHFTWSERGYTNRFTRVAPPSVYVERSGLAKVSTSSILPDYDPGLPVPEAAKPAIEYALNIWSYLINSSIPITVKFHWKTLGENIYAETIIADYDHDFPNAPQPGARYTYALSEMLSGQNRNSDLPEIDITLNSNLSNWYYNTDGNTPAGQSDLVTIVLHEIGHGLGFAPSFNVNSGSGSWGNLPSPNNGFYTIFDKACIVGDNLGTSIYRLTNTSKYPNPSTELGATLISNNIYFDGINSFWVNENALPKLHAPSIWRLGSSIAHLDEGAYGPGNSNSLMTPTIDPAEAIHSPGEITMSMLQDMGWNINRVVTFTSPGQTVTWGQGSTHTIKWTDTKSGAASIDLQKKNISGGYDWYSTIWAGVSQLGRQNEYQWTIGSSIPNGEYKLKFYDGLGAYGMSLVFNISNLPTVEAPQFNPPGGRYSASQTVSITSSPTDAVIHYTTDGTDPTESSPQGNSVIISTSTWLKARGFKSGYNPSPISSAVYTIGQGNIGVFVSHVDEFYQDFGGFSTWDAGRVWTIRPIGETFFLNYGDYLTIYANPDYKTGTTQKFWRWQFNTAPSIGYQNLISSPYYQGGNRGGYFRSAYNATIQTQLIDGSNGGGVVEFKDPWLPDQYFTYFQKWVNQAMGAPFKAYSSPLNPNTNSTGTGSEFKGVLLDRDPRNGDQDYYSARVLPTQDFTVNGQTKPGNFIGWSSENADITLPNNLANGYYQSPVIFHAGSNRVVSAKYKGHLLTSTSNTFTLNNQRKLTQWNSLMNEPRINMVYESGGLVWGTSSTDNGANWGNEYLLSNSFPPEGITYRNPTIEILSDYMTLIYAFESVKFEAGSNQYRHEVWAIHPNTNDLISIASYLTPTDQQALPVLTSTKYPSDALETIACYKDGNGIKWWRYLHGGMNSGQRNGTVPTTTSNSFNHAVTSRVTYYCSGLCEFCQYCITWEERNSLKELKYAQSKMGMLDEPDWDVYTIAQSNFTSEENITPTMVVDNNNNACVAWVYKNTSTLIGKIKFQKRALDGTIVAGSEKEFTFCSGQYPASPMLSHHRYDGTGHGNDLTLTWFMPGIGTACAFYNGTTWSSPFIIPSTSTLYPSTLSDSKHDDITQRSILNLSQSSAPYLIQNISVPSGVLPPLQPIPYAPPNHQEDVGLGIWVGWYYSFGASTYRVEVATSLDFTPGTIVYAQSGITATSQQLSGLTYDTWYYWRVNATNSNGTSAWSSIWSFKTYPYSPPGCPYVFSKIGNDFIIDNNILPQSEYPGNKNKDVTDYYKLLASPTSDNGKYIIEVREFERELSQLDEIKLLAVDHNLNTDIAVLSNGEIIEYLPAFRFAPDESNDIFEKLSTLEGKAYSTKRGDEFLLHFEPVLRGFSPDDLSTMEGGLLLGGWIVRGDKSFQTKEPPPGEKKISVGMVGGVNRGVVGSSSSFTFRERATLVYVPLEKLTTQVSIRFLEKTAFDFASLVVKVPTSSCSAHDLILESAKHSKVNDVTTKISGKDGVIEELYPDESIRLTYNALPLGHDKVRSFIVVANGRYDRIEGDQLTRVPVEFQLEKNYPNPFNPQTTIRYQLAKPGNVQVMIYNQIGQEVIKLVDTYQEVGYYEKIWDATDSPSGIYYIRMSVADQFGKQLYQTTHKLVVMK